MARPFFVAPLLCVALFVVAGCQKAPKETHDSILKRTIEKFDEMTAVLRTIQDEASSRAAAPKVQAIGKDIQDLKDKGKALGNTSAEDRRLAAAYAKPLVEAGDRMAKEVDRINAKKLTTPEFMAALKAANGIKQ